MKNRSAKWWRRLAVSAAIVAAAARTWEACRRRDLRRLGNDPERWLLDDPVEGDVTTVTAADGVRLHVQVAGPRSARATLVLVHGWGMSCRFWGYQLRDLSDEFDLVVYDQRGHGQSAVSPTGDYGLETLADDLDAVLTDHVRPGRPVVLVGHSLGGMTILEWFRHQRSFPRHDILGSVIISSAGEDVTAGIFAGMAIADAAASAFGRRLVTNRLPPPAQSTPLTSRMVGLLAHGRDATPAQVAVTEQLFFDCPADVRAGFGGALGELDLDTASRCMPIPTVVVAGQRDRLIPLPFARRLAARLPDARLVILDGAGHQTPLERHDDVNRIIRQHARGLLDDVRVDTSP